MNKKTKTQSLRIMQRNEWTIKKKVRKKLAKRAFWICSDVKMDHALISNIVVMDGLIVRMTIPMNLIAMRIVSLLHCHFDKTCTPLKSNQSNTHKHTNPSSSYISITKNELTPITSNQIYRQLLLFQQCDLSRRNSTLCFSMTKSIKKIE